MHCWFYEFFFLRRHIIFSKFSVTYLTKFISCTVLVWLYLKWNEECLCGGHINALLIFPTAGLNVVDKTIYNIYGATIMYTQRTYLFGMQQGKKIKTNKNTWAMPPLSLSSQVTYLHMVCQLYLLSPLPPLQYYWAFPPPNPSVFLGNNERQWHYFNTSNKPIRYTIFMQHLVRNFKPHQHRMEPKSLMRKGGFSRAFPDDTT